MQGHTSRGSWPACRFTVYSCIAWQRSPPQLLLKSKRRHFVLLNEPVCVPGLEHRAAGRRTRANSTHCRDGKTFVQGSSCGHFRADFSTFVR